MPTQLFGVHHLALGQVGKLQILQEQIDELVTRQCEPEIVLTLAVRRALRPAGAAPTRRPRDRVSLDIALVAGKQMVADTAG